jgi:two-component system, cell cycle sensor histidine kinase and response regulator CckA
MTDGSRPSPDRNLVLVVDDEDAIVRMATTILSAAGFQAVVANSGTEGARRYLESRERIRLVLTDVVMPGGGGLEMAAEILKHDPTAKILLMSGYSDAQLELQAHQKFPFIRKPFLPSDLMRRISEVAG